jgi:hypothetical protein
VVDFDQDYDHLGYTRQALMNDMDRIKIKVTKKSTDHSASGEYCKLNDWTTVHWKSFDKDGLELENSWTSEPPKPKVFQLGHFEVSKCWDIAL